METHIPQLAAMNICHRFFSLDSFLSTVATNGYQLVELWTGPMHLLCDRSGHTSGQLLKEQLGFYGLDCAAICPEQTNPKPANVAAKGEAAERTFAHFANALELAREIGAPRVLITSGWGFADEPRAAAWERSVAMLKRISTRAHDLGIQLVLEALQPEESNLVHTAAEVAELIGAVDSPALGACIDFGAMERAGDTIASYFEALPGRVWHTHFVDVSSEVTHVAWGDGHRDMAADLAELMRYGYQGVCSVETCDARYFQNPVAACAQVMSAYGRARERLAS